MRSVEPHVLASSEYFNFSPSALARTYLLHVLSVGEFTYEPGYDLRRSAFDSLLLEIILDGRVNLETEGERWRPVPGRWCSSTAPSPTATGRTQGGMRCGCILTMRRPGDISR